MSDDQRQKLDGGKSDPLMVEEDLALALEAVNRVLDYGKAKYGARGGWKQVAIERYRSAQARHRRAVMSEGIDSTDDESGLLHLAHEVANGLFILQTHMAAMTPNKRKKVNTFNTPTPVAEILAIQKGSGNVFKDLGVDMSPEETRAELAKRIAKSPLTNE